MQWGRTMMMIELSWAVRLMDAASSWTLQILDASDCNHRDAAEQCQCKLNIWCNLGHDGANSVPVNGDALPSSSSSSSSYSAAFS